MGFSLGGILAGFASREVERADQKRKEAMDLVKSTMNYRVEQAMSNRRKRQTRIDRDVQLGRNLMKDYGFTMEQVGALIDKGKLESVYEAVEAYQLGADKGAPKIDPNAIVKVADSYDTNASTFEEYVDSLYRRPIAAPETTAIFKKKQSTNPFKLDTTGDAIEFGEAMSQQSGFASMADVSREAFAGDLTTKGDVDAVLNLESLRTRDPGRDEDLSTYMIKAGRVAGAQLGSNLGLGQIFDIDGNYKSTGTNTAKDAYAGAVVAGIQLMSAELVNSGEYTKDGAIAYLNGLANNEETALMLAKKGGWRFDEGIPFEDLSGFVGGNGGSGRAMDIGTADLSELSSLLNAVDTESDLRSAFQVMLDNDMPQETASRLHGVIATMEDATPQERAQAVIGALTTSTTGAVPKPKPSPYGSDKPETEKPSVRQPDATQVNDQAIFEALANATDIAGLKGELAKAGVDTSSQTSIRVALSGILDRLETKYVSSGQMTREEFRKNFNPETIAAQIMYGDAKPKPKINAIDRYSLGDIEGA